MADEIINWPDYLPVPDSSLSGNTFGPVVSSKMESGRTRQRRRFNAVQKTYSVSWLFTMGEYEAFISWFYNIANAGTTYFLLPLPMDDALTAVKVRFRNGAFDENYVPFMHLKVTAQLECQTVPIGNETWLYVYEFSGGDLDSYVDISDAWAILINETLPNSINGN